MRRIALLASLFVPVALYACVTDDKSPSLSLDAGLPTLDGSTPDSPVVPPAEAGAPDADPGVDAGPAPVTVNVVKEGLPEANVTIVFSDATGALIDSAKTDATGRVTRLLPSGSQVTALLGSATDARILTVVGVEPGDVLMAIDTPTVSGTSSQGTITELPTGAAPGGTLGYNGQLGACGTGYFQNPPSYPAYLNAECTQQGKFPVLVIAQGDGSNVGFTFKKGNAVAPDGGNADVDMSAATWIQGVTQETRTVTNAPSGLIDGRVAYIEVADGVMFPSMSNLSLGTDAGVPPVNFEGHPGYPDFVQNEANLRMYTGSGAAHATIATRTTAARPDGGSANFDLSELLPFITDAGVEGSDAGRPSTGWTTASAVAADGAIVRFAWTVYTDGGGYYQSNWTVVAPPTVSSVTLPALPATESAWAPPADAAFRVPVVALVEASFIPGYAQLRAAAANLPQTQALISDNYAPLVPPLPVDGTVRMTAYTDNGD